MQLAIFSFSLPFPSRVGQRGSGLSMSAARSEHEVSEIIDGLSEQEVRPERRSSFPLSPACPLHPPFSFPFGAVCSRSRPCQWNLNTSAGFNLKTKLWSVYVAVGAITQVSGLFFNSNHGFAQGFP